MTKPSKSLRRWALCLTLLASACGDDDSNASPGDNNNNGGDACMCDPATGDAMADLMNAPVAAGVEVIQKTPTHPGCPGLPAAD